jgi:hypothetical protein
VTSSAALTWPVRTSSAWAVASSSDRSSLTGGPSAGRARPGCRRDR